MSSVDSITITNTYQTNQIEITSTSGITVTTVGTQGLAGPSAIMARGINSATISVAGAILVYDHTNIEWNASTNLTSLTQKLYNLELGGSGVVATTILDEDNMVSDSATALASQQSIKSYVDAAITVQDLDVTDGTNSIDIDLDSETLGLLGGSGITSTASGTNVSFEVDSTVARLTAAQTFTNKTLTAPVINAVTLNGVLSGDSFLDEDNFASNSATKVASQQSIKAYVDAAITAEDLDITDGSTVGSIDLDSETLGILGGTGVNSSLSGNDITLSIDNTVVTLTGTQTLTNKTLTTPVIAQISNTGTLSLPTSTDTLVGRATTDTLTNKTLTSPKINGSTVITTTGTEINVLDGDTSASSVVIVDADQFIVNDNGTMKQIAVTRLDTYISGTTATLTNKTLTSPVLNSPVLNTALSGSAFLDEDDMSSNSDTKVASQQSIKAYVDANITAQDLDVTDGTNSIAIDLDSESLSLLGGTGLTSTASGNDVTFAIDSTVATLTGTQTLTNKTIDVDNSTVSNIEVDNFKASAIVLESEGIGANDNDTSLPTSAAVKDYVDANITAQDLDITDGSTTIAIDLDSETLSLLGGTGVTSTASGNGVTFAIGQAVGTSDNVQFNQVTGALVGNASTATALATARAIALSGDVVGTANFDGTAGISISTTIQANSVALGTDTTGDYVSSLVAGTGVTLANNSGETATPTITIGQAVGTTDDVVFNTVTADLTGNASTATALETARTIGGTSFDGTANIGVALSATATALATARTIALAGDVTATGVSFDGTGNISLTTTIAANSVALGTDTTGNYVATIAGTANEVEVTGSGSENATITIGLPDNVTISGNLTVNGTTTTTDTNELHVIDPLIKLAKDNTANSLDIGFYGQYRASGVNNQFAGLFRDQNDSGKFKLFQLLETEPTTTVDTSGTGYAVATLVATLEGNVTGNLVGNVTGNTSGTAATVTTAAQPAITSVGTLTALQVDNININGNTISSTAGTDLNITPLAGQQIVLDGVINIDAGVITGATSITSTNFVGNLTGNADTATTLATARTIGGTSFDGSANIAIALANTATTLATARTIGGTSFDGSADIAIALANTATTLVNNRDFSITGDITASAVAFNGSGNVELSATIDNNVVDAAALNVTGNGTAGQALLSVGDGSFSWGDPSKTTEQIQDIVGGMVTGNTETGIAVTYEDGDGTLDFVINPAQTTITSLLATDIKIGEDNETKIDFETADEIHFYAANAHQLKIIDGALVPVTNNDIDLGTSSLEFKDAFFDGTVTSDAFAGPLTGAVTGNASTATALETARTIGGTSFDGTANIAIALSATTTALATARTIGGTSFDGTANIDVALSTLATNVTLSANDTTDETVYPTFADGATGTQGLETDTGLTYNPSTGMLTATAFTGALTGNSSTATALETARTIGGTSFDGSANIAVALSATATALATARTIGGVSFDGTANIDLAGVNTTGNQDTSGNAATATILATGRTINGVSFNGSANITTLTAGTGVAVSGTAVSIGQAVATSDSPTFANLTLGGTDSVKVPVGTTGQRNGSPVNGMFRYNSTNDEFEGYQDGAWGAIAGGGGASAMETDNFTGDGTTTDFTLTSSIESEDNLMVFIEGVFQNKATYAASGTTIAFATAPANTRKIVVFHVRASISGASMVQNAFTGNGSTTAYTLSALPNNENNTFVYIDGVYQNKATYSVSGTTLTFSTAPANTTAIEVMMFAQTSINVPASNSVTTSTIADGNVTTAKINNSAITLAKMAANSVDSDQYVDGSIDLIHMSANSVDSDQYVDGSIDTVHIADGAVTSAKLDTNIAIAGTLAWLVTGDITGDLTLLAALQQRLQRRRDRTR
jgi:hypothetical protein